MAITYQVIWSAALAYDANTYLLPDVVLLLNEDIRLMIWVIFLVEILRRAGIGVSNKKLFYILYIGVFGLFALTFLFEILGASEIIEINHISTYIYNLLLATYGLILTEQFYRNVTPNKRWAIKFLCIGAGLLFAYDLYLFSHATLFEGINPALWNARGFVNIVVAPLFLISAARNPDWAFSVYVSRQVAFYSSGLFSIGIYLTLMAFGGYYIQIYGGVWGREAQIIFLTGALVVLFVVLSSGKLRASLKLFLSKHFYENKYDYREEWMGFIQKLSHIDSPRYFKEQILQTVAMLMHSCGAQLFLNNEGKYSCVAAWNADVIDITVEQYTSMTNFMSARDWIIELDEYRRKKQFYAGLQVPDALLEINAWLIIPLKHQYDLLGFIVLLEPFVNVKINWEDRDLLKAVGKQVSSYIALVMTTESLAEAEKFSAFNRLSAYVVHDMKNSIAQLDLIVKNAEKFKDNPEFIADAFMTVSNVVDRMKRMLSQLKRKDSLRTEASKIDAYEVVKKIVQKCSHRLPAPRFEGSETKSLIYVEPDRFMNVIEHLITNAQDATSEDGNVIVRLKETGQDIMLEIEDTGCGMSQEFINNHLFKPFDTTKGNAGMGVGVFEAKEFVKYYNGELNVQSAPNVGTIFYLSLPIHKEEITFEPQYG